MTKLSFVIPCYRSENTISLVVKEIIETVRSRKGYDYEIVLVSDNSPDNVYGVITDICKADPKVKGIELARNFGQHSALMAGFRNVTGDIVIGLDDDGQTPASELFKLVDKLEENDLVFAKYANKKHSLFRNLGSVVNDLMARWLLSKPKNLKMMSYFACRRFVIEQVVKYKNPFPYVSGLLLNTTKRIANVEINHRDRLEGDSGYTIKKLLLLWFNGFTAFSVKPLRIATVTGFVTALIGFIYGIFIIINKFIHPAAPLGYSSTMAVMLFIGGVIMLMLGMIGEYIGRIYISLNNSPQYVIRRQSNIKEQEDE